MTHFGAVTTLVDHPQSTIAAFLRTNAGFATLATDQQLRTFDASGKLRATRKAGSGGMVSAIALVARPDGGAVLAATTKITEYDAISAKPGLQYKGHGGKTEVTALAYLSDGQTLASAGLVNIASTKANSVCLWGKDGALLHTILLPSDDPKSPCQPQRLVRAGTTDTLFAIGWAPVGANESARLPARHLFRIDADTRTVTRIATLSSADPLSYTDVLGMAASDDGVYLALRHDQDAPSKDLAERTWTTELRAYDFAGRVVASNVSAPQSIRSEMSPRRAIAVSGDGKLLAVASDAVELWSLPSLSLLERLPEPLATASMTLAFEPNALLFATSRFLKRVQLG
jgi:WD40 repeat protein